MILYKNLLFIILFSVLLGCTAKEDENEPDIVDGPINCTTTDISITSEDNIVINHATDPVLWQGGYTNDEVIIKYTKTVGANDETESFNFVFSKVDNCLKITRAFKYYDGKDVDVSAITEMKINEFYTKEWRENEKFTGLIVYTDPHNKEVNSIKFWVIFTKDDEIIENTDYLLFSDCFGNKLPIDIDMNKDGIVDYKLTYDQFKDVGNAPKYIKYSIKLVSTNEDKNHILSPIRNKSPYEVVYEAPFTSENKRQYYSGVRNELDVFYEFEAPYQNHNFFLNNSLSLQRVLENNKPDYYIVRMDYGGEQYYGWINFAFNAYECRAQVLDIFLNNVPSEHISVK